MKGDLVACLVKESATDQSRIRVEGLTIVADSLSLRHWAVLGVVTWLAAVLRQVSISSDETLPTTYVALHRPALIAVPEKVSRYLIVEERRLYLAMWPEPPQFWISIRSKSENGFDELT